MAYGDNLLALTDDGLYRLKAEQLVRLSGNYDTERFEALSPYWQQTYAFTQEGETSAADGTALHKLVYSAQGELYDVETHGMTVNQVTLIEGQATVRRVCALAMEDYVARMDNAPEVLDVAVDGSTLYLLLTGDPMNDPGYDSTVILLACELDTGAVREVLRQYMVSIEALPSGHLAAIAKDDIAAWRSRLIDIDPATGKTKKLTDIEVEFPCWLRRDRLTGDLYFAAGDTVYRGGTDKDFKPAFALSTNMAVNSFGACCSDQYGYVIALLGGIESRDFQKPGTPLVISGPDGFSEMYSIKTGLAVRVQDDDPTRESGFAQAMIVGDSLVDLYLMKTDPAFFADMKRAITRPCRGATCSARPWSAFIPCIWIC